MIKLTELGESHGTYEGFKVCGWTDAQMIELGYAKVSLPTFDEAEAAFEAGTATPVDLFVYSNEPAEPDTGEFRSQLLEALKYAISLGK